MKLKDFEKYRLPLTSEAQRLRDEFAKSFPALEKKLESLRQEAYAKRRKQNNCALCNGEGKRRIVWSGKDSIRVCGDCEGTGKRDD